MAKKTDQRSERATSSEVTTPLDDDSIQAEAFTPDESADTLGTSDALGAARWVLALEEKTEATAEAAHRPDAAYESDDGQAALAAANDRIKAAQEQARRSM